MANWKLAELRKELEQSNADLETCNEMLAIDPNDEDAKETIPTLQENIADLKAKIAAEEAKPKAVPLAPPSESSNGPPKYDMSKHPKFLKTSNDAPPPPPAPTYDAPTVFHVGNLVMAKWSSDKQWYQATIISKTGSSADPVYGVTFKSYGNTETNKRQHEIRAIDNGAGNAKKRKADGMPATAKDIAAEPAHAPKVNQQSGTVISAAAAVDTSLVQKREPSKVSDGPTRLAPEPKKLKGNKTLEKSKNSWNAWQQSGPKKTGSSSTVKMNKDSQFRTPDLPNAKVGFTGSGKPMQKDQARTKWNYGSNLDE